MRLNYVITALPVVTFVGLQTHKRLQILTTKESFCRICLHHVIIKQQLSSALQFLWLNRQQSERELHRTSFCGAVTCFCVQYLWCYLKVCVFVCSVFLLSGWCEEDISRMCYSDYAAPGGAWHCFVLLCGHRWESRKQQTGATAKLQRDLFTAAACTLFSQ